MSVGWNTTGSSFVSEAVGLMSLNVGASTGPIGSCAAPGGFSATVAGNGHAEIVFVLSANLVSGGKLENLYVGNGGKGDISISTNDALGAPIAINHYNLQSPSELAAAYNTVFLDPVTYNPALPQYATITVTVKISGKMPAGTSPLLFGMGSSAPAC